MKLETKIVSVIKLDSSLLVKSLNFLIHNVSGSIPDTNLFVQHPISMKILINIVYIAKLKIPP